MNQLGQKMSHFKDKYTLKCAEFCSPLLAIVPNKQSGFTYDAPSRYDVKNGDDLFMVNISR